MLTPSIRSDSNQEAPAAKFGDLFGTPLNLREVSNLPQVNLYLLQIIIV